MRLSIKAMAIVSALLWGGGILFVGLVHLAVPAYGGGFLEGISSIYPGFQGGHSLVDVLVGTGYALVDGGVGGFFLAWLYNVVSQSRGFRTGLQRHEQRLDRAA